VVVDVPSLEQIQVYLLSQTHMLPLTVLATAVERKSKNICDFNGQYSPLHIMRLPLRQVCALPSLFSHSLLSRFGSLTRSPLTRSRNTRHE
jgi:hypothetical protein